MTTRPVERPLAVPVASPVTALRPARGAGTGRRGRSLVSYLVLPRPGDLGKAVIVPVTFALGAAATGGTTPTRLWHAAVVWVVLELLVYQARYQWNDVRGFHADQRHPDAAERGRLPGPVERAVPHITASLTVGALRLAAAAAVALVLRDVALTVLLMTAGVFGAAAVYEPLRSAATGRSSQLPVPVTPALRGLWVAVGAGYTVRGMTGLALAVDVRHRIAAAVAAAVAMWALGVVFVTCRWALEALCFARFHHRAVTWHVPADAAREHSLALARWLPDRAATDEVAPTPKQWRALAARTPITAPWNVAFLIATAAAALAGRVLAAPAPAPAALCAAAVGATVSAGLMVAPHRARLVAVAAVAVAGSAVAGLPAGWLACGVAALLAGAAYAFFTTQCTEEIGRSLRHLLRRVRG